MLAYHAGTFTGLTWGDEASPTGVGPWVQHLSVGVSVFFVLSGFLLFRPFVLAHLRDEPGPAVGRYLVRRLVRIFPAYWLALFVSTHVVGLDLGDWWGHVRFYALLQVYWGDTVLGGLVQAWSLCTELSFYLFLPVWAAALARRRGTVDQRVRTYYLALAGLYGLGLGVRAWLRDGGHAVGYGTLPANCDLFALGMALAVASAASSVRGREPGGLARTLGDQPGLSWLAALCCYGAVVALRFPYGFDPPTITQEVARQVLFGLVALLVVAPGVFGPQDRGLVRQVLRWRPLVAAGTVSYGIYLWHLTPMIRVQQADAPFQVETYLPLVAWSAAASVVLATISWFGVERPLLRRVRSRVVEAGQDAVSTRVAP